MSTERQNLEMEIAALRDGAARNEKCIADFRGFTSTVFEEIPELRYDMMGDHTVRLFVPTDEIRDDNDFPVDERYAVGNEIIVTACGAIGRSNDRFKYVCTCGCECRSGYRYTIGEVVPIFSLPKLREASQITGIRFLVDAVCDS